ncbi:hypothetical protein BBP00_00008645 [Phytophthora kernoviae]|uniref:Uncharacterized protein n=1 Tax=Phytophthora kernoviae TaxID=325452 RepID=A0A3F2REU0_9STRA|nr:hypothetical protein BBP00_00008645 [Phytophthora kernoviae]
MPTALLTMEDNNNFTADFRRDSFDADSLSGLHTSWLDDEQLNNLPIMDVFTDVSTSTAPQSNVKSAVEVEKTLDPSAAADSMLSAALGDHDAPFLDDALDFSFDTELSPILEPFADAPYFEDIKEQMVKWPPTPEGKPMPPFSSLLLQRFDAISTKVRTKSVMEVRQFYTTVMQNITEMLGLVKNDIDLTNPDQVRIAVWCWRKLMVDKKHREEFEALGSQPVNVKVRLANVLHQSIVRSRRQMLKAKTEHASNSAPHTNDTFRSAVGDKSPGLTSISTWVSRSNLSSFFAKGNVAVSDDSTVQIHHPMVRKKHPASQSQVSLAPVARSTSTTPSVQQPRDESPKETTSKRKRGTSTEASDEAPAEKRSRNDEVDAATFMSPTPMDKRSRSRTRNDAAFHTPQQLTKKKIYIKMRMVPRDNQTKTDMVNCGCRPKVELKLSSTKKISEVAAHMSKKWVKVRPLLPKGAVLRFFQKNSSVDAFHGADGWSKEDSSVTCFDIWKHCGKQTKGENVVEVSYVWKVPDPATPADKNAQLPGMLPLGAPPGLFEQEVSAAAKQTIQHDALTSGDESEAAQLSPACGLQEFGEKVAFDRSLTDAAKEDVTMLEALIDECAEGDLELSPNTGRPRRRIQPVLVSTEEFNI